MSEETKDDVPTYTPKKVSNSGVVYSAPCDNCGYAMEQVSVTDHKAKCPECKSDNYVRHAD